MAEDIFLGSNIIPDVLMTFRPQMTVGDGQIFFSRWNSFLADYIINGFIQEGDLAVPMANALVSGWVQESARFYGSPQFWTYISFQREQSLLRKSECPPEGSRKLDYALGFGSLEKVVDGKVVFYDLPKFKGLENQIVESSRRTKELLNEWKPGIKLRICDCSLAKEYEAGTSKIHGMQAMIDSPCKSAHMQLLYTPHKYVLETNYSLTKTYFPELLS